MSPYFAWGSGRGTIDGKMTWRHSQEPINAESHNQADIRTYINLLSWALRIFINVCLQALNQVQITHKKASHAGIHAEESLLLESASREADFINTITDLEAELKHARQELDRLQAENEKLGTNNVDMTQQVNMNNHRRKERRRRYFLCIPKQKNDSLPLPECVFSRAVSTSGLTYLVTMACVQLSVSHRGTPPPPRNHRISKIPKPKFVSAHSKQLFWGGGEGGTPPPPQ